MSVLLLLSTAAIAFALAWPLVLDAPEPANLRAYLHEPPIVHDPKAWLQCAGVPNHLAWRAAYRGIFATGLDFSGLTRLAWLAPLASVCVVWWLARGRALTGVIVAALALSPAFATDWLLLERLRLFLPALAACVMVVLLQRPSRLRVSLALILALAAVFTHEGGSLLWLAMLPLLVPPTRDQGGIGSLAFWVLCGSGALALCYDETARTSPGLVGALVAQPGPTLEFLASALGTALPDVLAGTPRDGRILGTAMGVATIVYGVASPWLDADRWRAARPWYALALAGAAQAVAAAHVLVPQSISDSLLRQTTWGAWLLPVGLAGTFVHTFPNLGRRLAPYALGAMALLLLQDWHAGLGFLRSHAALMRQCEALLVFADLRQEQLPSFPWPSVPKHADRVLLRARGRLQRAAPLADDLLHGIEARDESAPAGRIDGANPTFVHGTVTDPARTDLVLLMRQHGDGPPHLLCVGAPNVLENATAPQWGCDLSRLEPARDDDLMFALAFDLRARATSPMSGRFVWRGQGFVREDER
ncbi:MAG: hypothetical protein R3F56_24425 [Planctomycetota bacterium]